MQASQAREGNIFLTYRNPYISKQEKLPMKAVTSLSEVAEWFFFFHAGIGCTAHSPQYT